jgi:hypothetical protein
MMETTEKESLETETEEMMGVEGRVGDSEKEKMAKPGLLERMSLGWGKTLLKSLEGENGRTGEELSTCEEFPELRNLKLARVVGQDLCMQARALRQGSHSINTLSRRISSSIISSGGFLKDSPHLERTPSQGRTNIDMGPEVVGVVYIPLLFNRCSVDAAS